MNEEIRRLYFQERLSYKQIKQRLRVGVQVIEAALGDDDFEVEAVGQCSVCPLRLYSSDEVKDGRCANCLRPGYL